MIGHRVTACMVTRLGIPVKQAIKHYVRRAEVFSERKWMGTTMYNTTNLREGLKRAMKDVTGNENMTMIDIILDREMCRT